MRRSPHYGSVYESLKVFNLTLLEHFVLAEFTWFAVRIAALLFPAPSVILALLRTLVAGVLSWYTGYRILTASDRTQPHIVVIFLKWLKKNLKGVFYVQVAESFERE